MIRVIKMGNVAERIYDGICPRCKAVLEFDDDAIIEYFDQINVLHKYVICPVCSGILYKDNFKRRENN